MRASDGLLKRRGFRPGAVVMAVLLVATTMVMTGAGRASAQGLTATWTSWLNSTLETYGDNIGQWTGGDNAVQVPLPGNEALWLYNDSFVGPVNADGTENENSVRYVHNTLMLTSGTGSSFTVDNTITGPVSGGAPTPAVPTLSGSPSGSWAWPADGYVEGNSLVALYNVFAFPTSGASGLNYAPVTNEIVTIPLSEITNPSTYSPPTPVQGPPSNCSQSNESNCVQWGVSMLNSTSCPAGTGLSSCTYVFGEVWPTNGDNNHQLVEAVTSQGLSGTWYYYDGGNGWTTSSSNLAALLGGASVNAFSAYQVSDTSYVGVESTALTTGASNGVMAYYSSTPQFTSTTSAELFTEPGLSSVPGGISYQFHIDPAYSSGSSVVMGFSVNSTAQDEACLNFAPYVYSYAYQPEFYSFTLPASASDVTTGTLPAPQFNSFTAQPVSGEAQRGATCQAPPAPTSFQVSYGGSGNIRLSWVDTGGLYQYDVRREDLTSASPSWTQFAYPVWDSPCPGDTTSNCFTDSASFAELIPGHTYLYELEAWNWNGGSSGWDGGAAVTLPAKITGVGSGLCDSVAFGSGQSGAGLDQEACIAQYAPQEWAYFPITPDPNANYEEYQIQSLSSDYCMEPTSTALGAGIEQEACTTAALGLWEFRVTNSNYDFELYNPGSGLCLGSADNSQSTGAWLVLTTCSTASNATWDSGLDY